MKLIEAEKVKQVIKDYWKAQVNKALILTADVNEANKRINSYLEHNHELLKLIDELPPIQPEQRWIPVSERLPEEGEVVLTQAKFKDDVKMAVSSRIDYNYWTTWGTRDINIIAWMPLPEPYQEDGEQDE